MTKLKICALGSALGLTWGLGLMLTSWLSLAFSPWGLPIVELLGSAYLGYDASVLGGFIGLAWGFVDGFIGGALIAFIYNRCLCCKKKEES